MHARFHHDKGSRRAHADAARELSRHIPTELRRACRASPVRDEATRSTWPHDVPTQPATFDLSAEISVEDGTVGVDPPVTKERPVATSVFNQFPVAFSDENGWLCPGFAKLSPERIADEGVTEEFNPVGSFFIFVTD